MPDRGARRLQGALFLKLSISLHARNWQLAPIQRLYLVNSSFFFDLLFRFDKLWIRDFAIEFRLDESKLLALILRLYKDINIKILFYLI